MQQETENAELKRQQAEQMKRIKALETTSNTEAISLHRSAASRRPQERFANKELLRVKAAMFVVGRPLTADICKDLVANLYENEPTLSYTIDTLRTINESKHCSDASNLNNCAVLELFSLGV